MWYKVWQPRRMAAEECLLLTRCLLWEGCDATWIKANLQKRPIGITWNMLLLFPRLSTRTIPVLNKDHCYLTFPPTCRWEKLKKKQASVPFLATSGSAAAAAVVKTRDLGRWTNNDPLIPSSWCRAIIDHNLSTSNILWILPAAARLCHYYAIPRLFSPSLVIDWILCQWPSQWKL